MVLVRGEVPPRKGLERRMRYGTRWGKDLTIKAQERYEILTTT
jgi:hypothetical protein